MNHDGEKDLCILYFLNPMDMDFEHEINGILAAENYVVSLFKTVGEFKSWARLSNRTMPKLFITDITHTEELFHQLVGIASGIEIICINNAFEPEHLEMNGNNVFSYPSYEDVIEHFMDRDEHEFPMPPEVYDYEPPEPPEPPEELELPIPSIEFNPEADVNNVNVPPPIESEHQTDTEGQIHSNLNMVTEYRVDPIPFDVFQQGHLEDLGPSTSEVSGNIGEEVEVEGKGEGEVSQENHLLHLRPREIQKQIFSRREREGHRNIGIWSPLHRTGVTSFTLNFALFLSHQKYDVTVLEGLTDQYMMKDWLKRYVNVPDDWISYAKAIQTGADATYARWTYENVLFLPLDKDDPQYDWNQKSLEVYMTTTQLSDVTLIDLPTGEMKPYTKNSLQYMDQLWIVVDDSIQEILSWHQYIAELKKDVACPIFLIFNKHYSFSQHKKLAEKLHLPVIACIPSLHEQSMRNYYERVPLYLLPESKEVLNEPYTLIANNLFEGHFTYKEQGQFQVDEKETKNLIHKFRSFFKPLNND